MLRSITIKNFIHFKNKQHLEFTNGPNFIVGANGTGKSALFELARRSLSQCINTSQSSITDKSKPAYCISEYENENANTKDLCCLLYDPKSPNEHEKPRKFVVFGESNGDNSCYLTGGSAEIKGDSAKEIFTHVEELIGRSTSDSSDSEHINALCNILREVKDDSDHDKCEEHLKKLTDNVVFTFPLRGIGPLQWSKSDRIKDERNYTDAKNRAEIIRTLLTDPNTSKTEEGYFNLLTYPAIYKFENIENAISVKRCEAETEREIPLFKVPEGILEAKQFSLILSNSSFQTVFLEEPDHGMHPQMVERMRDLILRLQMGKVIIIVSNNPSMISQYTMVKTHVLRSIKENDSFHHMAYSIGKKLQEISDSKKQESPKNLGDSHFYSDEKMKKALFAKQVLFVEGRTDEKLIRGVFDRILDPHMYKELNLDKKLGCDFEAVRRFKLMICSLQIISMDTQSNAEKAMAFAESIGLPFCCLLDRDTFVNTDRKGDIFSVFCDVIRNHEKKKSSNEDGNVSLLDQYKNKVKNHEGEEAAGKIENKDDINEDLKRKYSDRFEKNESVSDKTCNRFKIEGKFILPKDQKAFHDALQEKKIFIWRSGNLEDMINNFIIKNPIERILRLDKEPIQLNYPLTGVSKSFLLGLKQESVMELIDMILEDDESEMVDFLKFLKDQA